MKHLKSAVWRAFVRLLLAGFVLIWTVSTGFFLCGMARSRTFSWDALGAWGTVTAAGIAVITYRDSVMRACKLETIREFSRIRMKYPNMSHKAHVPDGTEELTAYLRELERFCVGILEDVYDLDVVASTAGNLLVTQYDGFMRQLIEARREKNAQKEHTKQLYMDYIIVIEKIRRKKQREAVKWGN